MRLQQKILIVDDDADIREVLNIQLTNEGYTVFESANGMEAVEAVAHNSDIDLVILDVMMPGMSGVETCTEIRKLSCVPVLFLTAKSKESDKAEAYDNGGDDYLVKPFSKAELMMKEKSLLRRYVVYRGKQDGRASEQQEMIQIQDILVSRDRRVLVRDGRPLNITGTEYQIFMYLLDHRGRACSAQEIYESVWKEKFLPSSAGTIMVHILNLRKKLELDPNNPVIIRTIWGKGYQIDEA